MIVLEFAIHCTDCREFICFWHHMVKTGVEEVEQVLRVDTTSPLNGWPGEHALCERCVVVRDVEKKLLGEEAPGT